MSVIMDVHSVPSEWSGVEDSLLAVEALAKVSVTGSISFWGVESVEENVGCTRVVVV